MNTCFTRKSVFSHLLAAILCFTAPNIIAQGYVAQNLNSKMNLKQIQNVDLLVSINDRIEKNYNSLNISEELQSKSEFFSLDKKSIRKLRKENLDLISVPVTLPVFGLIELNLYRQSIFTSNLTGITSEGTDLTNYLNKTMFYRGVVSNMDLSIVSLTITNEEISGVISIGPNNFNIGKIKDQDAHILYSDKDLDFANNFICDAPEPSMDFVRPLDNFDPNKTVQCVRLRVEVDNGLTSSLGGNIAAANYVSGLFNEVFTIYANDNIDLVVSEVIVWEGSSPYSGNASSILNQMDNSTSNADLTTLISNQSGGGVAWLSGLCSSNFGVNFSSVNGFYSNVPTYTWDVNVVAHELGHNLSSPHTHACAWNGNNTAIDGCGPSAGYSEGCSGSNPSAGGTIMSYCHLTSVGVNFNLGFGSQPAQRIRSYIDNSSCLGTSCGTVATCNDGIQNGTETGVDCGGNDCPSCASSDFELFLKIYLQGPYEESLSLMKDGLRTENLLPLTEPYSSLGFSVPSVSTNNFVLGVSGSNAIVDWVLVELRDESDPSNILARQAALIQRDGDIVNADGETLTFDDMGESNFYVAIRHRNHMGIRTLHPQSILEGIDFDFSSSTSDIYGVDPTFEFGGVKCMYSANANGDNQVNTVDKNSFWFIQNGGVFHYIQSTADFNMDGTINSVDKGVHWRINNSVTEQLD